MISNQCGTTSTDQHPTVNISCYFWRFIALIGRRLLNHASGVYLRGQNESNSILSGNNNRTWLESTDSPEACRRPCGFSSRFLGIFWDSCGRPSLTAIAHCHHSRQENCDHGKFLTAISSHVISIRMYRAANRSIQQPMTIDANQLSKLFVLSVPSRVPIKTEIKIKIKYNMKR